LFLEEEHAKMPMMNERRGETAQRGMDAMLFDVLGGGASEFPSFGTGYNFGEKEYGSFDQST
jgi:hypothetical protein